MSVDSTDTYPEGGLIVRRSVTDRSLAASAAELWDYSRRVFSTNQRAGEWVQIHDREGNVLNEVVALPVKDPYHVARTLMQMIRLGQRVSPEVFA